MDIRSLAIVFLIASLGSGGGAFLQSAMTPPDYYRPDPFTGKEGKALLAALSRHETDIATIRLSDEHVMGHIKRLEAQLIEHALSEWHINAATAVGATRGEMKRMKQDLMLLHQQVDRLRSQQQYPSMPRDSP